MAGDFAHESREQGIAAAQRGDRAAAQVALLAALTADAEDVEAWFWLAGIQSDPQLARQALNRVLALEPSHAGARAAHDALEREIGAGHVVSPAGAGSWEVIPSSADQPWEEWSPPRYQSWAETHSSGPRAWTATDPAGSFPGPSDAAIRAATARALPPPLIDSAADGVLATIAGSLGLLLKLLVPIVAIAAIILVWNDQTSTAVGRAAPDFQATDAFSGRTVSLSSLRGQPVWLNFWASWCPPCRDEMPAMQRRYTRWRGQGLVILGVDSTENEATIRQYVGAGGYDWSFYLDPAGATRLYHVSGIPYHVFIDRTGLIRATATGGISGSQMDRNLVIIMKP
ncbi:MAG TPA: TlpA disulfide reductase family protein [Chloroflexia bacterium]|nr:TlpA disulfide reductase family protein [Chloroflexia bacterium]